MNQVTPVNAKVPARAAQPNMPAHAPNIAPAAKAAPKPAPAAQALPQAYQRPNAPGSGARVARPARAKRRHYAILLSFFMGVVLPVAAVAWYLWERAADQYASTVAFSVRTEEASSALELLGGVTALSGSSSSDTDILYEFLQSQELVAEIDREIDLRGLWSKPGATDPWFAFDPNGTIEDLLAHWSRMVKIYYDDGAGLIEVRVLAFDAEDARRIADTLFDHSSDMINALSDIAREDAIRHAREELGTAQDRLKTAREAVTVFRNRHQLVDPSVDLQTQAGLLGKLESQLADALIEQDLLALSTRANDPRVTQAQRRIDVIQERIDAERRKLGLAGTTSEDPDVYANLFGEYERLVMDREFAERSYTSALASYDAALAEARRQTRYLAAYVAPTLAESARFPERPVLLTLTAVLIFLLWSTFVLVVYALKDRR
jgi:capsular polysaccharide transport system permease protein